MKLKEWPVQVFNHHSGEGRLSSGASALSGGSGTSWIAAYALMMEHGFFTIPSTMNT
jgi:hypothetical protein